MTTKKTIKKTTPSRSTTSRTSATRTPAITPPIRSTPTESADLPPSPADVVSEPVASVTAAPTQSDVPVKDYVHMQERLDEFMKENPNGVYFRADATDRAKTEGALLSLDAKTPVMIISKKTFTAAELQSMGFDVFQNGPGGKLVGIRK